MNTPIIQLQSLPTEGEEISLYDVWRILAEGWSWIVGGTIAGLVGAVIYLAATPPQFEAMALIQIGQIGQIGQVGQAGQTGLVGVAPIEAPARVVERLMFPTFKKAIVKRLEWEGSVRGAVYEGSLMAKTSKATDLVELRVRGLTREDAANSLNATIEHLAFLHREAVQPVVESLRAELNEIEAENSEIGKVLIELKRMAWAQRQLAARDRFIETMISTQLSIATEARKKELRRREMLYRDMISLIGKSGTGVFVDSLVPEAPILPRREKALMLGTLGGLFFGLMALALRRAWQSLRAAKMQGAIEKGLTGTVQE
jgi:uncharacterized protein involved in exopolysaccharide biosynthesis